MFWTFSTLNTLTKTRNNSVFQHLREANHAFNWERSKIVCNFNVTYQRLVVESALNKTSQNFSSSQNTLVIDNICSRLILRSKAGILHVLQRWAGAGQGSCCYFNIFVHSSNYSCLDLTYNVFTPRWTFWLSFSKFGNDRWRLHPNFILLFPCNDFQDFP